MHSFLEQSGPVARRHSLAAVTVLAAVLAGCGGGGGSDEIGVPTPTQIAAAQASLDDAAVSSDSIAQKQSALDAVEAPTAQ